MQVSLWKFSNDDDTTGYYCLRLFFCWVYLWQSKSPPSDDMCDSWAVQIFPFEDRYVRLTWGTRGKFIYLPWAFDWIETAFMTECGNWMPVERNNRGKHETVVTGYVLGEWLPGTLEPQSYSFRYITREGELQETTVTVRKVERRRRQWRLFRKLRLPVAIVTTYALDIWFTDEMGNQRGSWKGGVLGTGCAYIPGESIETAVRRFENRVNQEKRFCR